MKRLTTVEEVKRAVIRIDDVCSNEDKERVAQDMSKIFFTQSPYKIEYLQDQYNSFVGNETEEEIKKASWQYSASVEVICLKAHMQSLYREAEKETSKWFPFVDFIAVLNRQVQNLDILLIETDSGITVVRRANYCVIG